MKEAFVAVVTKASFIKTKVSFAVTKTSFVSEKSYFAKFIGKIYAETADKLFESSTFVQRF